MTELLSLPWRLVPLTDAHCQELCAWRYPEPYHRYNWPDWATMLAEQREFADPDIRVAQYCGAVDEDGGLVGFAQFFPMTGVTRLGLGLRPDLCGQGRRGGVREAGGVSWRDKACTGEKAAVEVAGDTPSDGPDDGEAPSCGQDAVNLGRRAEPHEPSGNCAVRDGLGTRFVRLLVAEALRRAPHPAHEVDLEVFVWNERAIRAYERAGFTITDTYDKWTPEGSEPVHCMVYTGPRPPLG
ncbi:GNAT family N-acetyltransferase [Paenibacillus ferrarius]|uniref:GNAT family N-acetyltransferase n=1 Tax=Paenibacillus ferrarius TaxID=1469647 RepID=UPI003D2BB17F